MKRNLLKIAALAFAVSVVSCGGNEAGDSKGANDVLGVAPVVFADISAEREKMTEEVREIARDGSQEAVQKRMKEFDEYAAKGYERAAKEGPEVVGNDVPFTGDPYENFKVSEVKIEKYESSDKTGNFMLRVKVEAKKDFTLRQYKNECAPGEEALSDDTQLHWVALDSKDGFITMGSFNPLSSGYLFAKIKADYQPGQTVKAGELCNQTGSPVVLSIHSSDFSDFAKLHFLSETDYQNIRRQAYGF